MKTPILFAVCVFCCHVAAAQYPVTQKAWEISYKNDTTAALYHFMLKMVLDCKEAKPYVGPVYFHDLIKDSTTPANNWIFDSVTNKVHVADPCIAFTSAPCYRIWYFHFDCVLPYNTDGYTALYIDCCRDYYQNIYTSFNASIYEIPQLGFVWLSKDMIRPGAVYSYNTIAGLLELPSKFKVPKNSSPVFTSSADTILYVCKDVPFEHVFTATDADGDSLAYTFSVPRVFSITGGPPHHVHIDTSGNTAAISYLLPYSKSQPLGAGVTLDAKTGLLQGTLHDTGSYLVTVGVNEYRHGSLITPTPHTRDEVIKVFDCSKLPVPKAIIPPLLNACNSKTISFPDYSSPYHPELYWDNNKYLWDFGDGGTSQVRNPVHTYDTGVYHVRLITMPGYRCADTAYSRVIVYPSVAPSFAISGNGCTDQPVKFTNT
ncbi:MAG TPA: PKD domain-containing protein, partial [Chitinophagaceae bacterium]|nr:PKD domain-containing protein [Chitinophagaceae bacterium]